MTCENCPKNGKKPTPVCFTCPNGEAFRRSKTFQKEFESICNASIHEMIKRSREWDSHNKVTR